jgi:hypothetical protein
LNTEERQEIATEMTLAAVRAVADGTNYRMLLRMRGAGATADDLSAASGLGGFATRERMSQLAAAGLASRDPQSDRVTATRLGQGLVGLVERVRERFAAKLEERCHELAQIGRIGEVRR